MVNPNPLGGNPSLGSSPQPDPVSEQQNLIVQALTQVLTPLGIRFKFSILRHPQTREQNVGDSEYPIEQSANTFFQSLKYRLWVRCQAQKSLDYQIIATLLAKTLHNLDLHGFQDAIVESSQSAFPATPSIDTHVANWRLRIDLIPPSVRYQSWARWGDVPSIAKLLNFALAPDGIQVRASLKNLTLQIFCTLNNSQSAKFPAKKIALDPIVLLLNELASQGIQGATIHGVQIDTQAEEPPAWVHWLDLPALDEPKFSPTPMVLAAQGDEDALTFVLERLLNPDLEQYFEVGGIRLTLMHHHHLLHVMCEAAVCPIQSQVAATVVNVMQQLGLPGISGVRVYGRRSGQIAPLWSEGVDFDRVPSASPSESPSVAPKHQFTPDLSVTNVGLGQKIGKYLISTGIWKPQISMDKTNQLFYQPRFRWQPSLLLLLVGFGLATVNDLAIKFALANKSMPTQSLVTPSQRSFNNPLLDRQLAQYQLRCLQHGVPDILIVGSSRALRGVNPEVLRRGLIDRGYANPKIYNFGINGATAQVVDLVLRKLLTPQQLPKMVIWADGSRAFNSGRSDRTYEAIIASEGYQQLGSISGAKTSNSSSLLQAQSSVKNTYQKIDNQIDLKLADISSAYHHRDRLKTWLQSRVPLANQPTVANHDAITNTDAPTNINDRSIDFDGFLAINIQFDPNTYYQKYPRVAGNSDGDYANFQLLGSQDRALQQVTQLLATRKIPLVFVNVPLTNLYLDKFRRQHERTFKQYMNKWMDSRRLTFVDMDGFLKRQYDRFSDPSHLNQWGASDVSHYLVQTKLIPWQVLNSNSVVDR
jgi:hypothetical protein